MLFRSLPESFSQLKNLQQLNLSFNPHIDVVKMMVAVSRLPSLQRLDLSFIEITSTQMAELKKALPDTKIFFKQNSDLDFQPGGKK